MTAGQVFLGETGTESDIFFKGARLTITDQEIITEARTADGTLVSDLKAVKKRFEIAYEQGNLGSEIDTLLALYDLHAELSLKICDEAAAENTYTVVMRPLSVKREIVRDIWLWSGCTLVLDEV